MNHTDQLKHVSLNSNGNSKGKGKDKGKRKVQPTNCHETTQAEYK